MNRLEKLAARLDEMATLLETAANPDHRRELEAKVWAKTHSDYKTRIKNRRYVMRMGRYGTELVPLDTMDFEELRKLSGD